MERPVSRGALVVILAAADVGAKTCLRGLSGGRYGIAALRCAGAPVAGGRWTGFAGKTLWDWLQLLVIPLALALLAFVLNVFENERDRRREADQTARAESLAAERAREDALDGYLDRMRDSPMRSYSRRSSASWDVMSSSPVPI